MPDPAARAQKAEVNGPSLVIDPDAYQWQNTSWKGRPWQESVVYELHIGTFTPEGTFRAAIEKLPTLAETGITMIEVLPVSQFGGNRGWATMACCSMHPMPPTVHPMILKPLLTQHTATVCR